MLDRDISILYLVSRDMRWKLRVDEKIREEAPWAEEESAEDDLYHARYLDRWILMIDSSEFTEEPVRYMKGGRSTRREVY